MVVFRQAAVYLRMTKCFGTLFLINIAVSVVTGIVGGTLINPLRFSVSMRHP